MKMNNNRKNQYAIYVSNLNFQSTLDDLMNHFQKYNPISAKILTNNDKKSIGCAFVNFSTQEDRDNCICLNGSILMQRKINVTLKKETKKAPNNPIKFSVDAKTYIPFNSIKDLPIPKDEVNTIISENNHHNQEDYESLEMDLTFRKAIYFKNFKESFRDIVEKYPPLLIETHVPDKTANNMESNELMAEGLEDSFTETDAKNFYNCESYDKKNQRLIFKSVEDAKKAYQVLNHKKILNKIVKLSYKRNNPKLSIKAKKQHFESAVQEINQVLQQYVEYKLDIPKENSSLLNKFLVEKLKKDYVKKHLLQVECFPKPEKYYLIISSTNPSHLVQVKESFSEVKLLKVLEEEWAPENLTKILKEIETKSDVCKKYQNDFNILIDVPSEKNFLKLVGEENSIKSFKSHVLGDFEFNIPLEGALKRLMHFKNGGKVMLCAKKHKVIWQMNPRDIKLIKLLGKKESVMKAAEKLNKFIQEVDKEVIHQDLKIENYKIPLVYKYKEKLCKEYSVSLKTVPQKKHKIEYRHKKMYKNDKVIEICLGTLAEQTGVDCVINPTNQNMDDKSKIHKFAGPKFVEHRNNYFSLKDSFPVGDCSVFEHDNDKEIQTIINFSFPEMKDDNKLQDCFLQSLQYADSLKKVAVCVFLSSSLFPSFDFQDVLHLFSKSLHTFFESHCSHVRLVRVINKQQKDVEYISGRFFNTFGYSNLPLNVIPLEDITSLYTWKWRNDKKPKWVPFERHLNKKVTKSYERNEKSFSFCLDNQNFTHTIHFKKLRTKGDKVYFEQINNLTNYKREIKMKPNNIFSNNVNNNMHNNKQIIVQNNNNIKNIILQNNNNSINNNSNMIKISNNSEDNFTTFRVFGLTQFVEKFISEMKEKINNKITTTTLANNGLTLQEFESICLPFMTHVVNCYKETAELIGTEQQIGKASMEISNYYRKSIVPNLEISYPSYWRPQTENCELFEVEKNSELWNKIKNRVHQTLYCNIKKIEIVQNKTIYKFYIQNQKMVELENGGDKNEIELFHGTSSTDPKLIYNSIVGFDHKYGNNGMWGVATYFAQNASYSDNYAFNNGDTKQLFLASVTCGKVSHSEANRDIRAPPPKHHCISGVTGGSVVYMTYESARSYPSFLITYTKKKKKYHK